MAVTSSNSAPVTSDIARFPVYATKAALLNDLELAVQGGTVKLDEVTRRMSNTDPSGWADKGSVAGAPWSG